jgi:endonuclease IV
VLANIAKIRMANKRASRSRPKIGFHAPIKGGLHQALVVAKDTGCDTVQIFSRNPRGWAAKPLTAADISLFRKVRRQTKVTPVAIHCNYLVNLAAADEPLLQKSRASFREEVERALLLGVDYLVVHPGSARGACEADGIRTCSASLKFACRRLLMGKLKILLENTAGQGECIGHRFDRHWHIGEGHIGADALRRVAQHPKLAHAAFILETPYDDPRADLKNLEMLRSFVENNSRSCTASA